MGGWKIGSAKPFRTIKTLIGVIDLEVCGPSQPWNSVKKLLSPCAAPRDRTTSRSRSTLQCCATPNRYATPTTTRPSLLAGL
jgi:hypothetical protein